MNETIFNIFKSHNFWYFTDCEKSIKIIHPSRKIKHELITKSSKLKEKKSAQKFLAIKKVKLKNSRIFFVDKKQIPILKHFSAIIICCSTKKFIKRDSFLHPTNGKQTLMHSVDIFWVFFVHFFWVYLTFFCFVLCQSCYLRLDIKVMFPKFEIKKIENFEVRSQNFEVRPLKLSISH